IWLFAVDVVQPLKRIVDRIVETRFAVGRNSHPSEAIEKLVLVLRKIRQDLRPDIKCDKSRPVVRPKAVDESGSGADNVIEVVAECIAELRKNHDGERRFSRTEIRDGLLNIVFENPEMLLFQAADWISTLVGHDDVKRNNIDIDGERRCLRQLIL